MSASRGLRADRLWRRLADAQDAALLAEPLPRIAPPRWARGADAQSLGRHRTRWQFGFVALVLGGAAAAVWLAQPGPLRFTMASTGERGAPGRALVADARSDLHLLFSDGSTVTFRAGAAGRVEKLTRTGADIVLEHGSLDAHVIHADPTIWQVHAGPFQVRVTGTRFSIAFGADPPSADAIRRSAARLELALYEGSVVVDGALPATAVPVQAGQRLIVEGGLVRAEPLYAPAPAAQPPSGPNHPSTHAGVEAAATPIDLPSGTLTRPLSAPPTGEAEWVALADRGAHHDAFRVAERRGWSQLCQRLDPRRLLKLGDVARYSGRLTEARQAFESLVSRFPRDLSAADAVFSLGRLDYEAGDPASAANWFQRYVDEWPHGPLADQAAGRLVECTVRLEDRPRAIAAARDYLRRAPDGPHAALAHEVLAGDAEHDQRR